MTKKHIWTHAALWLAAQLLMAPAIAQTAVPPPAATTTAQASATASALSSELFYQLLIGELTVQGGDPGAGFALILDAARKTNNGQLYQRATEIALQSRSGDACFAGSTGLEAGPASVA